jgi:hypothetical protein
MANRRQLYKYKGDRCSHCNKSVQEVIDRFGTFHLMFELNHVDPSKKDKDYENLIRRELSSAQLDEVDKCVLLCSFCHDTIHAQGITATVKIGVKVRNRRCEQIVKGQLILDQLDKTATMFTDDPILVWPYWVSIGNRRAKMHFGKELDSVVGNELRRLHESKRVEVRGWNKKLLMQATWTEKDGFTVHHAIHYPFIKGELVGENGGIKFWVRNGSMLSKDGRVIKNGFVTYRGGQIAED